MLRLMRLVRSISKNGPSSAVAVHSSSAGSSRSVKIRGTPEQAHNGLHRFQNPMQLRCHQQAVGGCTPIGAHNYQKKPAHCTVGHGVAVEGGAYPTAR